MYNAEFTTISVLMRRLQAIFTKKKSMQQTIAVKLKPTAERHIKKGHPWVFDDAIVKQNKEPKTGDLAIIFDSQKNQFLAVGLYDLESPIRIKIIQANQPTKINQELIQERLKKAIAIRKPLLKDDITGYRIINGENDGFPTLIADLYGDVLVVKLYSLIWVHYFDTILDELNQLLQPQAIVLRCSRNIAEPLKEQYDLEDGQIMRGYLDYPEVVFKEYGVLFQANVLEGHKTGYFLDHRENRHQVGQFSKGKSVLDVFSYAGGFSVHALANGATSVTSVDVSKQALELAIENGKRNKSKGKHLTIAGDAFEVLSDLGKRNMVYDIVVIDPPSFAKQKNEIEGAIHSYKRLVSLACPLVKSGGVLVMASCSSRVKSDEFFEAVEQQLKKSGARYQTIQKTEHAIDHPVTFEEGKYLKCGFYTLKFK